MTPQGSINRESPVEALITDGHSVRLLPACRLMPGQKVGVDECTIVFPASALGAWADELDDDDNGVELVTAAAASIAVPLGLELGDRIFANGLNRYRFGRELGTGAGVVCAGGNGRTVMLRITGHGAQVAHPNWPMLLHTLCQEYDAHITRIDLRFDDVDGTVFPVRSMPARAHAGHFEHRPGAGNAPKFEQKGEWLLDDPRNKGLSFYVGTRDSGKIARIYEKGKQLGDPSSPWVRFEVELHSSSFVLILDMLLHPTRYFPAFYPICEDIQYAGDVQSLEIKKNAGLASLEAILAWLRTQTGHYFQQLREHFTDAQLLDLICREGKPVPALQALQLLTPEALAELLTGFNQAETSKG